MDSRQIVATVEARLFTKDLRYRGAESGLAQSAHSKGNATDVPAGCKVGTA
jgi:hypothetical protein